MFPDRIAVYMRITSDGSDGALGVTPVSMSVTWSTPSRRRAPRNAHPLLDGADRQVTELGDVSEGMAREVVQDDRKPLVWRQRLDREPDTTSIVASNRLILRGRCRWLCSCVSHTEVEPASASRRVAGDGHQPAREGGGIAEIAEAHDHGREDLLCHVACVVPVSGQPERRAEHGRHEVVDDGGERIGVTRGRGSNRASLHAEQSCSVRHRIPRHGTPSLVTRPRRRLRVSQSEGG